MPKPTPEEKLFSVIQGAKATPLRGKGSAQSFRQQLQRILTRLGPIDLPRVNRLMVGLILILGAALIGQFFARPSVDRLMAGAEEPAPFHIAPPLQGLKPLEEYLPKVLEQDPFRVGQAAAPRETGTPPPAEASKPDPKSLISNMRLVGVSWGDTPTAMIEQDKQTYFLKPGHVIGSLSVKDIQKDHVILKSGDQEVELF